MEIRANKRQAFQLLTEAGLTPSGTKIPLSRKSRSPRDRVVRAVLEGLYKGRYQPGDRLIEARLTQELRVSRGPVREALNRLAAIGVVSLRRDHGAQIRSLTLDEAIDVLLVVRTLVGLAAELAANRIGTPEMGNFLLAALQKVRAFDQHKEGADYAIARDVFYTTLVQISGNRELGRALSGMQTHLVRVQFGRTTNAVDVARHDDYETITKAVLAGRSGEAGRVARTHIDRVLEILHRQKLSSKSGFAKPEAVKVR